MDQAPVTNNDLVMPLGSSLSVTLSDPLQVVQDSGTTLYDLVQPIS